MKDHDILIFINNNFNRKINISKSIVNICKKREFAFNYIKEHLNKFFKVRKTTKYLDIGCGDGSKTLTFAKIFNINHIYGTDINTWGPYFENKKFNFNFKLIENDKLNYDSNSFNIITCFVTLHHVKNLDKIIEEIYRILKKNGILIIIEHDILNYLDQLIVDIEHLFFSYFYDNNENYINNPDYALYFNNMEFRYLLSEKYKFKYLYGNTYYESINMHKKYDQQFFQIYKK